MKKNIILSILLIAVAAPSFAARLNACNIIRQMPFYNTINQCQFGEVQLLATLANGWSLSQHTRLPLGTSELGIKKITQNISSYRTIVLH